MSAHLLSTGRGGYAECTLLTGQASYLSAVAVSGAA